MRLKSDIPFGSQFSPKQINLPKVLEILSIHGVADAQFTEKIRLTFFNNHANGNLRQQTELAKNVRLSLRAYGVVNDDDSISEFGRYLISLTGDYDQLVKEFAKHILLNLNGMQLLRAKKTLDSLNEDSDLISLARELERIGIHVPNSGTHISTMRQWLQEAGIVDSKFNIDEERFRSVMGFSLTEVEAINALPEQQKVFLKAFSDLGVNSLTSSEIAKFAEQRYHLTYNPKNLPKDILFPLEEKGYIELEKTTAGRGAKPYLVKGTEKFNNEYIEPILKSLSGSSGINYMALLQPMDEIMMGLKSENTYQKGVSLELLAIFFCRLLGLQGIEWRKRSIETGGSEIDLVAEGTNFIFYKWQIQCKNTKTVGIDDIDREIGVALNKVHPNAILIITTGSFTKPAVETAKNTSKNTNINVILIDGPKLWSIVENPVIISTILRQQATELLRRNRDKGGTANGR